jgi:hypothetical protein
VARGRASASVAPGLAGVNFARSRTRCRFARGRAVGQTLRRSPERLSPRSVTEAHDTPIVNPHIEPIGDDQAAILTDLIMQVLDLQLKRQVAVPRSPRPRVSLIIDEAPTAAGGQRRQGTVGLKIAFLLLGRTLVIRSAPVRSRR